MAAQTKAKTPVCVAAMDMLPCSKRMMSFGNTGTMMPKASMSSSTDTKINAKAERPCLGVVAGGPSGIACGSVVMGWSPWQLGLRTVFICGEIHSGARTLEFVLQNIDLPRETSRFVAL